MSIFVKLYFMYVAQGDKIKTELQCLNEEQGDKIKTELQCSFNNVFNNVFLFLRSPMKFRATIRVE